MSIDATISHLRKAKAAENPAERLGHLRIARATLQTDSLDLEKQLRNEDENQGTLALTPTTRKRNADPIES